MATFLSWCFLHVVEDHRFEEFLSIIVTKTVNMKVNVES